MCINAVDHEVWSVTIACMTVVYEQCFLAEAALAC